MNVLSLFDGMSCGQLALRRAVIPYQNYFSSEIDKYCIKVTQENFPDTIQLGDIVDVMSYNLPRIHLLIGGSPCQGFSYAGKKLNFKDEKSKLFFEYVRLFRSCAPDWFLLENVRMKKEWENIISSYLGVEPVKINSSLVSAQNRTRNYWTNIPFGEIEDKHIYWCDVYEEDADCFYYTSKSLNWLLGTEDRKRRYKEYQPDEKVKMQMLEASHYKGYSNQRCFGVKDNKGVRYISPRECERLQNVPDDYTASVSNTQRYKMLGNGWTVDVLAHIFKGLSGYKPSPHSF